MAKTIWKYQLEIADEQEIQIPNEFEPLYVSTQNKIPCLWCLVDPVRSKIPVKIVTHGTGHFVSDDTGKYLGTYTISGGNLVFHVFLSAD